MPDLKFPTAWSYSRLAQYRKCPRQFFYAVVERRPMPKAPAMERGTAVHKAIEDYLARRTRSVPKIPDKDPLVKPAALSKSIAALYKSLREAKVQVELEYTVDARWRPTMWTDWTGAWLRAKLDARLWLPEKKLSQVFDHKTGKERAEEHAEQMEIYAVVEWAHQPDAEEIHASMVYVDAGTMTTAVFTDREATEKRLRKKWTAEVKPMFADRKFKAAPGRECGWCPFSGRRGGPCDKG